MKLKESALVLSLFVLFTFFGFSSKASYNLNQPVCSASDRLQPRGGPVIWPWGSEVPMNMNVLQGLWMMADTGCSDMYAVRILKEDPRESVISIVEYDPVSCRTIAAGKGYLQGRVIRAVLAGGGKSYGLSIHAFRPTDLRALGAGRLISDNSTVYVLRRYEIGNSGRPQTLVSKISKLDKNPTISCD